ncbi:MAG: 3-deoxy-D-manno-octulosonic acid kinase [Rhizobium sp.]|nr:3-deoxy-D-manno-octulosonic acid kinase [Rhizobium sp.]
MGIVSAALETQPFRDERGTGAIVFDPARLPQASAAWLDPAHWSAAAEPVARGGRGAAWFVGGDFGQAVLRRYRRGGLAARLSADRYLWLGEARVRSLAEFRLMAELHASGLRVPAPLLAGYWREGIGYRAAILVERIEGARPFSEWLSQPDSPVWEAAGLSIAHLHHAGVEHADLNANNLLVDPLGRVWIIDFDRGVRRAPESGWREANLRRLARSLAKLSRGGSQDWERGFARLRSAYERAFLHAADHLARARERA